MTSRDGFIERRFVMLPLCLIGPGKNKASITVVMEASSPDLWSWINPSDHFE
jgi:hypothetical protein